MPGQNSNDPLKDETIITPEPQGSDKKEDLRTFFNRSTPRDVIAYIIMIIGIILILPLPILGGVLVGLIAGIYFGWDIIQTLKNYPQFMRHHGFAKSLILAGTALAILLVAPAIIFGVAIAVCLRILLVEDKAI